VSVDWEACPRVAPGIQTNEVADGYVVYDPDRERVHYLNNTAVLVLELCTGKIKAADMPHRVQTAYNLPETPVVEVEECLQKLYREGLVH
jgi:coenzyme PQQ synthesis protein D (PqqD)